MAIEQQIILSAVTGQAVTNVNELKASIKELKDQVGRTTIGTEDYQQALTQLQQQQNALRGAMYGTKSSLEDITAASQGVGTSYNALVHQMAALKNEFRATSDEARRMELGGQINDINNKLKAMDALQGNFQRNVGNYGNALGQAFTHAGTLVGGPFVKGVQAANGALKLLSTNPIMAVVTIAIPLIQKIVEGLAGSEENANAMNTALSALKPITDAFTKVLQFLGGILGSLVGGFVELTKSIFGTTDAMAERQAIAEKEIALAKMERDITIQNAEAMRDSEKARAEAASKDKITSEERIALLEKASKLEEGIAQRNYQAAKEAYEIKKRTNALTDSSTAELQEEADLYAKMIDAERNLYSRQKELNAQLAETRAKLHAEEMARRKEELAAQRARLEAEKELVSQTLELTEVATREHLRLTIEQIDLEQRLAEENAKAKITDQEVLDQTLANIESKYIQMRVNAQRAYQKAVQSIEVQGLKNRAALLEQGTIENLRAEAAVRIEELKNIQREEGETQEAYDARKIAAEQAVQAAIRAIRKKEADQSTEELTLAYEMSTKTAEATLAYELQMAENNLRTIEQLGREVGETETAYLTRVAQARAEVAAATNALLDNEIETNRLRLENRMLMEEEGSFAYLTRAVELKKYELDTLHQLEGESNEEFQARELAKQKEYNDAKAEVAKQGVAVFQSAVGGISGLLGSLADAYESDSEASEEQLKAAKNMRIAGATMDMLSGVVTAISTAAQLGPILGPIMAAVNSATIIAAGIANINNIKKQSTSRDATPSGGTPTAPAAVSAPQVTSQVQQFRAVTTASEEARLDQMAGDSRVVLVMSDLEVKQNARRVQVEESTF